MKLKGTITLPNGEVSNVELSEATGNWKSKVASAVITVVIAAGTGAATYVGQVLANIVAIKVNEISENRKKKKKKQK